MRIALMVLTAMLVHATVAAEELRLEIRGGRVTLDARDISIDRILAQWEAVGGTAIVGRDQISLPPVTLRLEGVTEREALDAILRGVAGFVAQRRANLARHASIYERIVILARSEAPATALVPVPDVTSQSSVAPPFVPQTSAVDPRQVSFSPDPAGPHLTDSGGAPAAGGYHAPIPGRPGPGAAADVLVQGLTGRRAEPGMVPVVAPPAPAPQPSGLSPRPGWPKLQSRE